MKFIITLLAAFFFFIFTASAQSKRQGNVPDRLLYFQCSLENTKVVLSWSITNNNVYRYFEVQKSDNGKDFTTTGIVFTSEKPDTENYSFKSTNADSVSYYRLKLITVNDQYSYSKIIVAKKQNTPSAINSIRLLQNPVLSDVVFQYNSPASGDYEIVVYTVSGIRVHSMKRACTKGVNMMMLSPGLLSNSQYILEVNNGSSRSTTSFVKQ